MKTITIDDSGVVTVTGDLTDEDRLNVGEALYDQSETDNDGQILFYTGIYDANAEEESDDE